ncbi:MAG: aspartate aminotransferase family protein [Anaerolineales bacterium]|nr:aspartate aminotransferase family protein [Anaerolineales bacterium]
MTSFSVHQKAEQVLVQTYPRPDIVFDHGIGSTLYDETGKAYLDFGAGIAVNALGHSDSGWVDTVTGQAGKLVHISNLFHTRSQIELAEKLVGSCFADRLFFVNSGSEANETAIKFARKWASQTYGPNKTNLAACTHSFHGRTCGALSLTAKEKYRAPFEPLVPGVSFLEYNNIASIEQNIGDNTCAVFVEPVQGEGGVYPADPAFLQALREACDRHNALLVVDEVQCGLGRTGSLWAHEQYDIVPDMMTIAKPLAGGLPIGAALASEEVASLIVPGDHGNTFAGGPLTCAAGLYTFDRISQPGFLSEVAHKGKLLLEGLKKFNSPAIVETRGKGLLIGVELSFPVKSVLESALENGLIVLSAGENVLRICPPLTITEEEISSGLAILENTLKTVAAQESI